MTNDIVRVRQLTSEIDGWLKAQRLGRGIRCIALTHTVEVRLT